MSEEQSGNATSSVTRLHRSNLLQVQMDELVDECRLHSFPRPPLRPARMPKTLCQCSLEETPEAQLPARNSSYTTSSSIALADRSLPFVLKDAKVL